MSPNRADITQFFRTLQDDICAQLEAADGEGKFQQDMWERPGGGGGRSRVIQGRIIEKGGVNFSAVHGLLPEKIANALKLPGGDFYATGVSIVLHPHSPMVPIIHMNVRYFEVGEETWWFGGGIDLTPHYIVPQQARWFHEQLKTVCDRHDAAYYPDHKQWADEYFYLKHRKETRGVGGIFFDRLSDTDQHNKADRFAYVQEVGQAFAPIYTHFMHENHGLAFTEKESLWQAHRRGRYVEFNLVWDKGTKFGLDTDGRTQSILMSMPPMAKWTYQHEVLPNSAEAKTQGLLRKEIDWVNYTES